MKLECILISAFCVVSCTNTPGTIKSESSKNEYDYSVEYPNVDIRKKYPEKTIRLDEIASIEYISIPSTIKDIGDCALSLGGKGSNLKTIEYAGDKESFKNIFNGGFLTFKTTIVCNDGKLKYSQSKYEWVDIK